jgi:peptide/nickel transport system permease protein
MCKMEAKTAKQAEMAGPSRPSPWREFLRNRTGTIGLLMLTAVCAVAIFAPWIAPYDPYGPLLGTASDFLAAPSPHHILGQDDAGRDVLSLVIYGARVSLLVGFSASLIGVSIGSVLGMISGYFGRRIDMIIMRVTDAILVVPRLPLMLVIIAVAGRGILNIILVIGFLSWTYMARVVRSQVLTVKERQFVLRARAIGAGHFLIMVRHILPQVIPVIFAEATLDVSYAILSEATLSFLGLGDPLLVSWGSMLNRAYLRGAVTRGAWWFILPPGLALAWVTLGLTFLSSGIQEIVNPRLKTHHLFDERKTVAIRRVLASPASDEPTG